MGTWEQRYVGSLTTAAASRSPQREVQSRTDAGGLRDTVPLSGLAWSGLVRGGRDGKFGRLSKAIQLERLEVGGRVQLRLQSLSNLQVVVFTQASRVPASRVKAQTDMDKQPEAQDQTYRWRIESLREARKGTTIPTPQSRILPTSSQQPNKMDDNTQHPKAIVQTRGTPNPQREVGLVSRNSETTHSFWGSAGVTKRPRLDLSLEFPWPV
ncbi:hypothetical protein BDP67DRAFT_494089 [Colletotrichum lupini]|nr:hypothetical protein BDP67DRAFT_494089 [Colletotrichum lupini]